MWGEIGAVATPYAFGLGALLVGQVVIRITNTTLREKLRLSQDTERGYRQSAVLGILESILYLGALVIHKPEFVAVWLGVKTVIRWRHWESDIPVLNEDGETVHWVFGRDAYNLFLIGNGLVLLYAAAGWQLIELVSGCHWPKVWALVSAVLAGSALFLIAVWRSGTYPLILDGDPRRRDSNSQGTHAEREPA